MSRAAGLPWRGPGPDQPRLPLPPARMPLRMNGLLRKRWRYVGVFGEALMLCAARAEVGPFGQCFWVAWDRREGARYAGRSFRPGSSEVRLAGPRVEIRSPRLRASLRLSEGRPIEAICPSGSGWGWTRKRAGIAVEGAVEAEGRRWELAARGIDDESAGYHERHTSWRWSAGVGRAGDGRELAWNLVEGINDPPRLSERAIWLEGQPFEPEPVAFDGMRGIGLSDRDRIAFVPECEHAHDQNLLLVRSRYRLRFGAFSGSLGGGVALAHGLGVMEEHDAVW